MVSAGVIAKDRGIAIEELLCDAGRHLRELHQADGEDGRVRPLGCRHRVLGWAPAHHPGSRYQHGLRGDAGHDVRAHQDRVGFIGDFGTTTGRAGVNIATLNLGRTKPGGDAITVVALDAPVSDKVLDEIVALPGVLRARRLQF